MLSALLIHGVPIECINQAAITYHVPAALIMSILGVEGGEVGMASPNKNGTFDYGPMQINTIWVNRIKPYGYTEHDIQYDPCANVMVGAWILSSNIAESANLWRGIGGYHSYTDSLNRAYQHKVWNVYSVLAQYLSNPPNTSNILPDKNSNKSSFLKSTTSTVDSSFKSSATATYSPVNYS